MFRNRPATLARRAVQEIRWTAEVVGDTTLRDAAAYTLYAVANLLIFIMCTAWIYPVAMLIWEHL